MYYLNGTWLKATSSPIHPEDRGYQFGDGIYEVIRIYKGQFYQWDQHLIRLFRSANELKIRLPWSKQELFSIATELMEKNNITPADDAILYMQITRGVSPRQFPFPQESESVLSANVRKKERPVQDMQNGIATIMVPDIRWLRVDIKTLNLLGAVLSKQQAIDAGAKDAIQHRNGIITECSSANLFAVKNQCLYTHPETNLILHGITRQTVIQLAKQLQITVIEEPFDLAFLQEADELFLTGTTSEITPIISVDGKLVAHGNIGSITKTLQAAFEKSITQ